MPDQTILNSMLKGELQAVFIIDDDVAEATKLVNDLQDYLAVGLANSSIRLVEENTRVLAVPGRLPGFRRELKA